MTIAVENPNVIAVFTGKSLDHILQDGGSQSWVVDRRKAKHYEYLVCCRSGVDWVEGPEPHGSAFLVGRISDVVPSTETPGRSLIKISAFARVDVGYAWRGWRNPVRYTNFEELGIEPEKLTFEPMPGGNAAEPVIAKARVEPEGWVAPLTIAEAKRGLARSFGVAEDAIEITIRG